MFDILHQDKYESIRQDLQFSMMKLDNKYLQKQTMLKKKRSRSEMRHSLT